jgi:hypothetical protein
MLANGLLFDANLHAFEKVIEGEKLMLEAQVEVFPVHESEYGPKGNRIKLCSQFSSCSSLANPCGSFEIDFASMAAFSLHNVKMAIFDALSERGKWDSLGKGMTVEQKNEAKNSTIAIVKKAIDLKKSSKGTTTIVVATYLELSFGQACRCSCHCCR